MTAPATLKLPRLVLFALAAAYIIAGLFGRDPWKTDDVLNLATMLSALRGDGAGWLIPHIGTLELPQDGPLVTWVGAFSIYLLGPWLGDISASRIVNVLWFSMTMISIWYGTYLLGRRTEAQPLPLPFGGEPTVKDYGRLLADTAALLWLATIGILQRLHETSVVPANVAFQAFAFYALARMLDKPKMGMACLAIALAGSFLTRAWPGVVPVLLAVLIALHPRSGLWSRRKWIVSAMVIAALLVMLWWLPTQRAHPDWFKVWIHWNVSHFGIPDYETALRPLRDLPWFLWPIWPLACLAVWQWRRWITAPHIWLPLAVVLGVLFTLPVLTNSGEPEYMLFATPLAVLAAFALPTMRRGVINTLDWFALMCFSVTVLCVWIGWTALHFKIPKQISLNIARLTTGYEPHITWWSVIAALVATLCWIAIVIWRLRWKPSVLWRGSMLCASGVTITWVLLVLLWMPAVDYVRSYRPMSAEINDKLTALSNVPGQKACLRSQALGVGPQASLYVFDNIQITYDSQCPFVLQQTTRKKLAEGLAGYSDNASVLWMGSRGADRFDRYRLLRVPVK
jgi:4-amino-4-deoxy-L-arabinose transferase-like glycosyltransferase